MKIQCSVCETAEAKVLCCADEAALCWGCDQKVHAANKLAGKHQRVLLSSSSTSSETPKCDICQEIAGYFFCLEDRALLCRKCDAAIHSTNALVCLHQRFLLTGVKLAPESPTLPKPTTPMPSTTVVGTDFTQWPLDEILKFDGGFNQNATLLLSKANSEKLGDPICSRPVEGSLEANECVDQMPETFWAVPQITSQLTESELHLSKSYLNPSNCATFVPDVISPWFQISRPHQEPQGTGSKRRRQF
ncbi:B-box zinc finger protein 22 [Dorcoceras hygrometricum]|uniref:B-box zinc finger protein 22 n=1 Tax=Dorcoceras hygrometricum TaxID=472368 RepID=A0A2Z7CMW8_9LAMI|nr:B-box zinc finger protein 22 [Dorcoceras hygrometricum]